MCIVCLNESSVCLKESLISQRDYDSDVRYIQKIDITFNDKYQNIIL